MIILRNLLSEDVKVTVAEGGAGTGKSILAVFLFKLLSSDFSYLNYKEFGDEETEFIEAVRLLKLKYPKPRMALVVPMSPFRETLKKVFKNVKGLHPSMVVAPADITRDQFDIIVVDEAHRLRQRVNLGSYFRAFDQAAARLGFEKRFTHELEWVLKQSSKTILFYDENQSIKPSDIIATEFRKLRSENFTNSFQLKSQLRVKGGVDYVQYVSDLMSGKMIGRGLFSKTYEFRVFDSIQDLINEIKDRDNKSELSRLAAGYSWEWKSKKNKSLFDINIENVELRWNSPAKDWINSTNAINEVGCIHTTQGYDLNYAGIIFGNEISYDFDKQEIVIKEENYFDRNGKVSINDPAQLKYFIINIYKTILLRGIHGTFVYACDPLFKKYLLAATSESSDQLRLVKNESSAAESFPTIPLYNFQATAGAFSDLQSVEISDRILLPSHIRYSEDLFCCKVVGESMNKIIRHNSICLFRKDHGGSRHGKIVLVQHFNIQDSDWGNGFTIKEYRSRKTIDDTGWKHESITLHPLSEDPSYKVIELNKDEIVNLKVVGIFEKVLIEGE